LDRTGGALERPRPNVKECSFKEKEDVNNVYKEKEEK